jgi:chromosome segregation ATPase
VSVNLTTCYALLGVAEGANPEDLEAAWTQRRHEVSEGSSDTEGQDLDAALARLDEAYNIVSDPTRSALYDAYLQQTDAGTQAEGPEVFGALYEQLRGEKPAVSNDRQTMALPFEGPALRTLAELVIAAPAPGELKSSGAPPSVATGEIPPWMDRPIPTGDVPVTPPLQAEAREENFLSNLEVQGRLQGLHEHLAAADLIRRERNELLRQVVKVRAELEMRAAAEADLRKSLEGNDHQIEDLRRELEHFRMVAEEAEADLRDLAALQSRVAGELVEARDKKEAAELIAMGARADLEVTRVRVGQLEQRIGSQDGLLEGERKVAESLRAELSEAEKRREAADSVAGQARGGYRMLESQLVERDSRITELERGIEQADHRASEHAAQGQGAAARCAEAVARVEGLLTEAGELRVALEDSRAERIESGDWVSELESQARAHLKRVEEAEHGQNRMRGELDTIRSTLADTKRTLEVAQQQIERQEQRGDSLESEVRNHDGRQQQQVRLVEELQEEIGGTRRKFTDLTESLELARTELADRVRHIREIEEGDETRNRELDQFRRSRDRIELDLQVARKEGQRRADQLGQAREEIRRQTEEYLTLRRDMGQRQSELEQLRRDARGAGSRHTHELEEVRRQSDQGVQDLEVLREEIQRLRADNGEQREQLRHQRTELSELAHQRDELTQVLEDDAMNDDELSGAVDDIMSLVRN